MRTLIIILSIIGITSAILLTLYSILAPVKAGLSIQQILCASVSATAGCGLIICMLVKIIKEELKRNN